MIKYIFSNNYLINIDIDEITLKPAAAILVQPVTESFSINSPYNPENFDFCIEVGFLPGVTDNIAHTVRESFEDFFKMKFDSEKSFFYTTSYFIKGEVDSNTINLLGREFFNPLLQRIKILSYNVYVLNKGMGYEIPVVHISDDAGSG